MTPGPARWVLLIPVFLWTAGPGLSPVAKKAELTVSAAASLKDALEEIRLLYQRANPDAAVAYNFGGSGALQRQIEQGAPVDVFLSAAPKQMDALEAEGLLLAGTRKNLLKNRVVLVAPRNSSGISSFQDLAHEEVKWVALCEPQSVPIGKYAEEVLRHAGIYDRVKTKAVFARDVRQVLAYVASGNVDAGVVYATDARASDKVRVVAEAPAGSHSPVVYPVAALKQSRNLDAAREFVRFLGSPAARTVFEKYGFALADK